MTLVKFQSQAIKSGNPSVPCKTQGNKKKIQERTEKIKRGCVALYVLGCTSISSSWHYSDWITIEPTDNGSITNRYAVIELLHI